MGHLAHLRADLAGATKLNSTEDRYGFFEGGHNNSAFYASPLFKQWVYGQ